LQNLRADPKVQVRVRGQNFAARARVLSAEKDAKILADIRAFASSKYGWGEGTVVEIMPEGLNSRPGTEAKRTQLR
jgi:F420H(2)-dependent quinone reductase